MKKIILLSFSIVSFAFMNAMEYRRDETKQPETKVQSKETSYVTLISSDNHEFKVPQSIAFQVPKFKAALTGTMKEGQEQQITLSYSTEILELFLRITTLLTQSKDLSEELVYKKIQALLADYDLQEHALKDVYIECIDNLQLPWLSFIPVIAEDLATRHKGNLQAIEQEILANFSDPVTRGLIAKYHYLHYGKFKQFLNVKADYGFSVKELISCCFIRSVQEGTLDLSNLKINNLIGLFDIPGIEDVKILNLSHNQLDLEACSLSMLKNIKASLQKLISLNLGHNLVAADLSFFKGIAFSEDWRLSQPSYVDELITGFLEPLAEDNPHIWPNLKEFLQDKEKFLHKHTTLFTDLRSFLGTDTRRFSLFMLIL
jgi:hypothetical protein